MITVVCWNIKNNKRESWEKLREMEDADVALLQEAGKPPSDLYPSCILGGRLPGSRGKSSALVDGHAARRSPGSPTGSRSNGSSAFSRSKRRNAMNSR